MAKKKTYFFLSNWDGKRHEFTGLRAAKIAARQDTGLSVSIIELPGNKIHFSPASGNTPA